MSWKVFLQKHVKRVTPFKFGLLITAVCLLISYQFYHTSHIELSDENTHFASLLNSVHQKTIDFRLRARGPVATSEDVVLLTVDEPALEVLGRWPWSRKTIADIIARLQSYEAKVIGFDAIFAEPENIKILETFESLALKAPSPLKGRIQETSQEFNTDLHLSRVINSYSDHLIMGAYWDNPMFYFHPHQEICLAAAALNQDEYRFLEKDQQPISVIDQHAVDIPFFIYDFLEAELSLVEEHARDQGVLENLHESQIDTLAFERQNHFCATWLTQREGKGSRARMEDMWENEKADIPDVFQTASFEDFLLKFKSSFLKNDVFYTGRWWTNTDLLNQGTKYSAYFNAVLDSDGTIRRSPLIVRWGEMYFPSLALKSVMLSENLGALATIGINPLTGRKSVNELALTDPQTGKVVRTIPVDSSGRLTINFAGPKYSYAHLSAAELFNDKSTMTIQKLVNGEPKKLSVSKSEFIQDKIFLFGATAIGIFDLRVTPFSENYPGLETHANVLGNLLSESYLHSDSQEEEPRMLLFLLAAGILLSYSLSRTGAIFGLLVTLGLFLLVYYTDKFAFFQNGILVNITLPFMLLGFVYVGMTFFKYLTEERKKKELKGTFQKYVSPSVVNEILKDPSHLELGGKKETLSVLFSDIRGFTSISESLDPHELTQLLNLYLTPMTHIVFENKGTLDKYMGDAVMAFFGAPIHFPEHAQMACKAALEMMKKLKELNSEFKSEGLPTIEIGIGINTGEMNVGNMGSDIVRSYTVMGDAVNLGARLEGINKQYGTHIVISEFTKSACEGEFFTRPLDLVRVKGKKEPVKIYELLPDDFPSDLVDAYTKGFNAYQSQDFQTALKCFETALSILPTDGPSLLYKKRSESFLHSPPPKNWDGVYQMETK